MSDNQSAGTDLQGEATPEQTYRTLLSEGRILANPGVPRTLRLAGGSAITYYESGAYDADMVRVSDLAKALWAESWSRSVYESPHRLVAAALAAADNIYGTMALEPGSWYQHLYQARWGYATLGGDFFSIHSGFPASNRVLATRGHWKKVDRDTVPAQTRLWVLRGVVGRRYDLALSEATAAYLRWRNNGFRAPALPRNSGRAGCRWNMSPGERRELAQAVRDYVQGDGGLDVVADVLNSSAAQAGILAAPNGLSFALDRGITFGECGHFHDNGDDYETEHGTICAACAEGDSWAIPEDVCDSTYYHTDDLYFHDSGGYYTYPEPEPEDEDEDNLGRYSYGTRSLSVLSFDHSFVSSSSGRFHIGVEFECVPDAPRSFVANIHRNLSGKAMCKSDGSLPDDGVEVVTWPTEYVNQVKLFKDLDLDDVSAWDTEECGLHVHIDSKAFTQSTLAKFMLFWNSRNNATLIRRVAGRHASFDDQAKHYAALEGMPNTTPTKALKGLSDSRYRIVNLCNLPQAEATRLGVEVVDGDGDSKPMQGILSTVEVRAFRASTNKRRLLAQIEMAAATVYFARDASYTGLGEAEFLAWLATRTGMFPKLARFLAVTKSRRLQADEPIEA